MRTPRPTSSVTSSWLNGRLALGISALPGSLAKTVWYDDRLAVAERPVERRRNRGRRVDHQQVARDQEGPDPVERGVDRLILAPAHEQANAVPGKAPGLRWLVGLIGRAEDEGGHCRTAS